MNPEMSEEQFLEFVLDVGARATLRAQPLSQEEIEELDKRLEARRHDRRSQDARPAGGMTLAS